MIKIQAYQSKGVKKEKLIGEWEFCCWDKLLKWIKEWAKLNKCKDCLKEKKNG